MRSSDLIVFDLLVLCIAAIVNVVLFPVFALFMLAGVLMDIGVTAQLTVSAFGLLGVLCCAGNLGYCLRVVAAAVGWPSRLLLLSLNLVLGTWGSLGAPDFSTLVVVWLPMATAVVLCMWRFHHYIPGRCACGYDLSGNVIPVCPECGEAVLLETSAGGDSDEEHGR